jgi:hypothetical protein
LNRALSLYQGSSVLRVVFEFEEQSHARAPDLLYD